MANSAATTEVTTKSFQHLTVNEFKTLMSVDTFDIIENPKTGKLFASGGGKQYRVQSDLNFSLAIEVLVVDEDYDAACFINKKADNVKITL